MISAARIRSNKARSGGFTLLEIVIVLLVIAVLGGGAIAMMALSSDERVLNDATSEVQSLAKRARTIAGLQQRPYALEFYDGKISLMPLAEAVLEPDKRAAAADALEAAGQAAGGRFNSEHASWSVDEGTQIFIRRWASDEYLPVTGKNRQVWRFDPEGPCEPITVRFQIDKSWIEVEFNPLTASIRGLPAKEIY
jgi:prepilin-type N-terminal cleavage/methylation domain-containing protein